MPDYSFTMALEVSVSVTAPTRAEAQAKVLRATGHGSSADLWEKFNEAEAMEGLPAKGLHGASVRRIGGLS